LIRTQDLTGDAAVNHDLSQSLCFSYVFEESCFMNINQKPYDWANMPGGCDPCPGINPAYS